MSMDGCSSEVVAQTRPSRDGVVTGRKSWKMSKQTDEVVWPPNVEAALLEALHQYEPMANGKPGKALLRFPRRNRFISEYIHRETGVFRTAKQVGSRLQQLRDTCADVQVQTLLRPNHVAPKARKRGTLQRTLGEAAGIADVSLEMSVPPQTVILQLCDPSVLPPPPPASPTVRLVQSASLWRVPPTVAFTSPALCSQTLSSFFAVLLDGHIIHTETTDLPLASSSPPYTYKTLFIPLGWAQLSLFEYLSTCTVTQYISESVMYSDGTHRERLVMTVLYQFQDLRRTPFVDSYTPVKDLTFPWDSPGC